MLNATNLDLHSSTVMDSETNERNSAQHCSLVHLTSVAQKEWPSKDSWREMETQCIAVIAMIL